MYKYINSSTSPKSPRVNVQWPSADRHTILDSHKELGRLS